MDALIVQFPLLTGAVAGVAVGAALLWFWSLDEVQPPEPAPAPTPPARKRRSAGGGR